MALRDATKIVVEGLNQAYPAFRSLSLDVYPGERLGVFSVNGAEAKALVACLSGVEPLDAGTLEQAGSVSWPLGSNEVFVGKLSGYANARFAAEIYSSPGQIEADLELIQALACVPDDVYHEPFAEWPAPLKNALKLAVSLAFEFDVITVGRISGWSHRYLHPDAVRIRECFERRIDGRTLIVCANGQSNLAIDYCDEGIALVDGEIAYRGDPALCLEMVKEEAKRQKQLRRARVIKRVSKLTGVDMGLAGNDSALNDQQLDDSQSVQTEDDGSELFEDDLVDGPPLPLRDGGRG